MSVVDSDGRFDWRKSPRCHIHSVSEMDVVVPYAGKPKGADHFELKYSLRSLDAQPWVRDVYLAGVHLPRWYTGKQIPLPDVFSGREKDKNLILKNIAACNIDKISDPFVVNSDDQYFLCEVQPRDLLWSPLALDYFTHRRVTEDAKFRSLSWYRKMQEMVEYCASHGKRTEVFEGHCPHLVFKQEYVQIMNEVPWMMGDGFLITIYQHWAHPPQKAPVPREGVCFRTIFPMSREALDEMARGENVKFFNHNDRALDETLKSWLMERYPEKSRWEDHVK